MSDPGGGDRSDREHGDRAAFVGRLRARLATGIPANTTHPAPPPLGEVPAITYHHVDPTDLLGSFMANAARVGAVVHRADGAEPDPSSSARWWSSAASSGR